MVVAVSPWSEHSAADGLAQGDADCSDSVDTRDALADLRYLADIEPIANCVIDAGDVDCSGEVGDEDVLALLFYSGGITPAAAAEDNCPDIGDPIGSTPTGASSPTPTATPTVTGDPGLTASPAPSGTPRPDGYHTEVVMSAAALGPAKDNKIELALIPGAPDEAIVALQSGYMYRVSLSGAFPPELWGDIHAKVTFENEQGLLSLAFSPEFQQDGDVYLYYTPGSPGDTILSRYQASATGLNEASEEIVLPVEELQPNHNGGHIIFDHDGNLLLSLGDGGGAGDPGDNGQDLTSLLGKVIRIDVSGQNGYAIPQDNPFIDGQGGDRDEIFAYGFRNPFRMSIDRLTGDVWLGDVGQNSWEEVDHVLPGGNYGWDCYEGFAEFDFNEEPDQCTGKAFMPPRAAYDHNSGAAVTGGFVYRGSEMLELFGWYVYGDFYSGIIWAANTADNSQPVQLTEEQMNIASWTEQPNGELLIVSYTDGVYKLVRD
jgi:glucose/arabinose dehydrogenase